MFWENPDEKKLLLRELHARVAKDLDIPQQDLANIYTGKLHGAINREYSDLCHRDNWDWITTVTTAGLAGLTTGSAETVAQLITCIAVLASVMGTRLAYSQYDLHKQRKTVLATMEKINTERETPKSHPRPL